MNASLIARLLALRRQFRRRDLWTRRELEIHQAGALRDLREFAYSRSRFYQRFHKGLTTRPLHELPVLTKATLMEKFDDLVTDPAVKLTDVSTYLTRPDANDQSRYLDRYSVASTSGTTGLRGFFLSDKREWATVLASYVRASDWAGIEAGLLRRVKLAVVASRAPWHQSSLVGAALENSWVPTIRLDAADPLPAIVARLEEFRPELLVAYSSVARLLAEEQLGGRLHIAPRWVLCASEVLTVDSRRQVQAAWGSSPFNVYGATEPAGIASECAHHSGLHQRVVSMEVMNNAVSIVAEASTDGCDRRERRDPHALRRSSASRF